MKMLCFITLVLLAGCERPKAKVDYIDVATSYILRCESGLVLVLHEQTNICKQRCGVTYYDKGSTTLPCTCHRSRL
jgi:hypothetical protein